MPYIFIWGSFTLIGLPFTRITNGTIEKYWGTRKGGISKQHPNMYVSKTAELMIGQCTREDSNKKRQLDSSSEDDVEQFKEILEEKPSEARDRYKKTRLLKPHKLNKKKFKGFYSKPKSIFLSSKESQQSSQLSLATMPEAPSTQPVHIAYKLSFKYYSSFDIITERSIERLRSPYGRLDDAVIESYMKTHSLNHNDLFVLPSQVAANVALYGPVYHKDIEHWSLFFINVKEETVFYLDPMYSKSPHCSSVFANWLKVSNDFEEFSSFQWKHILLNNFVQKDSFS